jgi:hypothetical protein
MVAINYPDVEVASSNDGLHFGSPTVAVSGDIWDPTLAQIDHGRYVLVDAPNQPDQSQRNEASFSDDFVTWSAPVVVTNASNATEAWWDFWPEANTQGSLAGLYFASERPMTDGGDAGTSHIWRLATK